MNLLHETPANIAKPNQIFQELVLHKLNHLVNLALLQEFSLLENVIYFLVDVLLVVDFAHLLNLFARLPLVVETQVLDHLHIIEESLYLRSQLGFY